VPVLCLWDFVVLGMFLAWTEHWPLLDGMWYIINGAGYQVDVQDSVSPTDDIGKNVAIFLFCHVYVMTNTLLGFTSLLRIIRLGMRKLPDSMRNFILVIWLLGPLCLLLLGFIFSVLLSGTNDLGIYPSFLLTMDFSLTRGHLTLASVDHSHQGPIFLGFLLAIWTFSVSGALMGIVRSHPECTGFMSFLEGIDPDLHPLQRLKESNSGRYCKMKPYALSAADAKEFVPARHPRSRAASMHTALEWLQEVQPDTLGTEAEKEEKEHRGPVPGEAVAVPVTMADAPGPDVPFEVACHSPAAAMLADSSPVTMGKAFMREDVQNILRSLKAGVPDNDFDQGYNDFIPTDFIPLEAAGDNMPRDVSFQDGSGCFPSLALRGLAEDWPRDASSVHIQLDSRSKKALDIDALGGSMAAYAQAQVEEAASKMQQLEERAREAEKRAQEFVARVQQTEAADAARKQQDAVSRHQLNSAEARARDAEAILQDAVARTRQLEERASDAERRAQESEQKFLKVYLEKTGLEESAGAQQGQSASHVVQAAEREISELKEKLRAVEVNLQEAQAALGYERDRASAAEARFELGHAKEQLMTKELVRTKKKLEEALQEENKLKKEVEEAEGDGEWGDDSDEEKKADQDAADAAPPRNGAEALERLKARQSKDQTAKEQAVAAAGGPDWRDTFQKEQFQRYSPAEPDQIFCAGVRDCGKRPSRPR